MTIDQSVIETYEQEIQNLRAQNQRLMRVNEELEQSVRASTIFFERSTELLSIIGFDGIFRMVSPAWLKLLGYREEEMLNQPFFKFVHPDDIETTQTVVEKLLQGVEVLAFENRYRAKDGSYRSLLWNCGSDVETQSWFLFTRDLTEFKETERERNLYIETIQKLPHAISIYEYVELGNINTLYLRGYNAVSVQFLPPGDIMGKSLPELFPGVEGNASYIQIFADVIRSQKSVYFEYQSSDNDGAWFGMTIFPLPNQFIGVIYEDISERKRNEEAMRQAMLQEEIIRAQEATLAELSTPLIPISDEIMVMPLIGTMDSRRAQQVMEAILEGMSASQSQFLILDITGVNLIDTQVANSFIRAAQATKLLGAQVMITGIRPEVAQTLVGLGVDLTSIITCSSLQRGIALANSMQNKR